MTRFTCLVPAVVLLCAAPLAAADSCKDKLRFSSELTTAQEVPTPGPGLIERATIRADFDRGLSAADVELKVRGGNNLVAAHFHCALPGRTGPVVFGLISPGMFEFDGEKAKGTLTNANATGADCVPGIGRPVTNIAGLALAMREGLIYANVHTSDNPPGEVRGQMFGGGCN